MRRPLPRLLVALLAAACASCAGLSKPLGVTIASDPPGARILIDGRDSGFVTPYRLGLDDDSYRLDLVLPGYRTATRRLVTDREWQTYFWSEQSVDPHTWRFPMWIAFGEFFAPVRTWEQLEPGSIFVRLEREVDGFARAERGAGG